MQSGISINSPFWLIAVCAAVAFGFALILYWRNRKTAELNRLIRILLFSSRFIGVLLICLLILDIVFKNIKNETQNPVILLAIDNSASMRMTKDSLADKRFINEFSKKLKATLDEKYVIKQLLFGSGVRSDDKQADFSDKETDLSELLEQTENNYSNSNVGAMIVLSDGILNRGRNPLYNSKILTFPIYTIPFGDTTVLKDLAILKTDHNNSSYLGNVFPVSVSLLAKKLQGQEAIMTLREGSELLAEKRIRINSDNELATVNYTLNAEKKGLHRYTISVNCNEKEINNANNSRDFVVEVIDQRSKILLLSESPHPDLQALRSVIEINPAYELKLSSTAESELPEAFSLIIIHSYSSKQTNFINQCKKKNVPMWFIKPGVPESLNGITFSGNYMRTNDAEPVLNKSFGLFTVSDQLRKLSGELPAVKTIFGNYSVANGSHILFQQKIGSVETENPIYIFNELNGYKTCLFLGDGLWRWKMRDFAENGNTECFQELVSKTIQYLSVKNEKSFFRLAASSTYNEDQNIEMTAEVFNKSYEPITEPDVEITVTNADKKTFKYFFSKSEYGYKLNAGKLAAGEYTYEAKVNNGGDLLLKKGSFAVKEIVAEGINTVADHGLLNKLALSTGGQMFNKEKAEALIDAIQKNETIKPITYSTSFITNIIDLKWILLLIILALSVEWLVRKNFLGI